MIKVDVSQILAHVGDSQPFSLVVDAAAIDETTPGSAGISLFPAKRQSGECIPLQRPYNRAGVSLNAVGALLYLNNRLIFL